MKIAFLSDAMPPRSWWAALWFAAALMVTASTASAQAPTLGGSALASALKQGGYVIFLRHAATDMSKSDSAQPVIADCATQRNLSNTGRTQARNIGQAFDTLQIPVGQVLASPYCRTLDTAQLAFARARSNDALIEQKPQNETTAKVAESGLRPLLAASPTSGTNTVLVSHGFNLKSVSGFQLDEGEAAVFRPDGKGGFNLVTRIQSEQWGALASTDKPAAKR